MSRLPQLLDIGEGIVLRHARQQIVEVQSWLLDASTTLSLIRAQEDPAARDALEAVFLRAAITDRYTMLAPRHRIVYGWGQVPHVHLAEQVPDPITLDVAWVPLSGLELELLIPIRWEIFA
ncbi:hypothetical protein [Streptomyces sp. cg35]|uniref:hypothetical protein n=1 Tax=Streptomyces sp. cg35 TaxID=3421650 RepID=UPI003D179FD0